jgi:hypothetical protein
MAESDPLETLNLVYADLYTLFDKLADTDQVACAALAADIMAMVEERHPGIASRLATKLGAED